MRKTSLMLLPVVVIATLALSGSMAAAAGACSSSSPQYCPTPTVTTGSATAVTTTSATLNGTVNTGGAATNCIFGYGTTNKYGKGSTVLAIPANNTSTVTVSEPISSLSPGTTYHFELVCGNAGATGFGGDKTLTTTSSSKPKPKPPKSKPKLKQKKASVSSKGVVKLTVVCSNSTACKGKLSVTLKKTSLGKSISYSVKGKKSKTVSFKLSSKALKQLKKAKHHTEKASAKVADTDKGSSSGTLTLTFK
jgi:hypothetical protein